MSEGDFAIAWTAASRRALTRLPEKVATAVVEFLYGSLAASPHRVGKPLKLGLEGLHSARRGDYRVVYRIDDQQRLVTVMAIEHRSDAYRPRSLPVAEGWWAAVSVDGAVGERRVYQGPQAFRQLILAEVGGVRPSSVHDGDLVAEAVRSAWRRRRPGGQGSEEAFGVVASAGWY